MKLYRFLIVVLLLSGCSTCHADELYKKKSAFYSYIIGNIKNDKIDSQHAPEVYATPASCQKTITSLLAYKVLGHDFQYKTKLLVKKNGAKIHDVIIEFSGDPTLTSEKLGELLRPLKGKNISGSIILDASLFKTPPHSTYLMISDIGRKSAAPVSSINIDQNLIRVQVIPTKLGKVAKIESDSPCIIDNSIMVSEEKSSAAVTLAGDKFVAKGHINAKDQPLKITISPKELKPYILDKIKKVMKGLNIKGKIYIEHDKSKLASNLEEISVVSSEALSEILPPAMKISDNLTFDSLYLTIVHATKPEGIDDWSDGDFVIRDLIKTHFNIDVGKSLIIDGSGLSRYNRIQPKTLYRLLQKGYSVEGFVDSMPKNGEEESTLISRNLQKNIRAKTGTLAGVTCLCGYDIKSSKVFVIIANSFAPPVKEVRDVIDEFLNGSL